MRRFLFGLSVVLLMCGALRAESATVSLTVAQLKAAINSSDACRTSLCTYNVIAGDVDDAAVGTNFTIDSVKGPATWYAATFAGPPAGADWNDADGRVYLSDNQAAVYKLKDDDVFSFRISSPNLTVGQRVRLRFTITGSIPGDIVKTMQTTLVLSLAAQQTP